MLSGFFYEFLCNCRACGNSCKASQTGESEDGLPVVQAAHASGAGLLRGEMLTYCACQYRKRGSTCATQLCVLQSL